MIIELFNVKNSPHEFEFSLAPTEIEIEQENVRLIENVETTGKLTKGIVQTDVEGTIRTSIEVECTRCLQPVEKKLEFPFKVSFITPENFTEAKEAELNETDLDVSVYEDDKINLSELVREQIILNLPEQFFCSEGCKGLCDKCGANRNLIDCKCEEKEIDPRWAALKELKRDT
ncbi:MAG: YceD family protein [Pyrinomonadaceae bacterium]